jgi:lipopolysaccharide biosynthesis regulator YciM
MFEWLFFLLPIAALSGWLLARKHYKNRYRPQDNKISPEYFKGLNYLLNEQPDKAIDVFIRLLEVNSETVETHLALANLFRRRGETDRSIRIHQNLIARPSLNSHQRTQALVELGLDYMHAGVLDRAEQLFLELQQQSSPPQEAIKQLLRIYQQEKHWEKAIKMAKQLRPNKNNKTGILIAQFYCELAEKQLDSPSNAKALLKQAHLHDNNCVRASLMEADLEIAAGHYASAIRSLLRVENQDPLYLPEALPRLLKCYQQAGNMEVLNTWLQQLLKRHPQMTSIRLMLTQVIAQQQGKQTAQDYLYQQLHHYPSIEGLHTLLTLGQTSHQTLVPLIETITKSLIQKGDRYKCHNCGFSGKTIHWQCPGCTQWGCVRPSEIHLSDLEKLLEPSQ